MTPIESLIEEMKFRNKHEVVLRLQIMLVHEKYFMRKVAENAWNACEEFNSFERSVQNTCSMIEPNVMPPDKETYLNQNHPI